MIQPRNELAESRNALFTRSSLIILLLILFAAAVLRFSYFGKAPPGLNQDEAVNAWNAYCLLKTGKDQVGDRWPVFYMRGIGGNWSPLYAYLSMPFQIIGGLSVTTTRLPPVAFGILTIALIYYVGRRLFNEKVGLLAALLLTINPWHFQQCRWGHESSIAALLGLAPLAMMLWSNLIPADDRPPRPFVAALAGLVTGICCYGYQPVRVFVPAFLLLTLLLTLPQLWQNLKKPNYLLAAGAFTVAFAVIFIPLLWQHIFHPEGINRHFFFQQPRFGSVGLYESLKNSFIRYIQHFSTNFLFSPLDYLSPPKTGLLQWYMLPLLLAGLITLAVKFRTSVTARILLAFILAYPVGDSLVWGQALSSLRSFVGLGGIILLAALGAISVLSWLWKRYKILTFLAAGTFAAIVVICSVYYFVSYFRYARNDPVVYEKFHTDLVEACDWLCSRYDNYDAVYVTTEGMNMPYIIMLVVLNYNPHDWFHEPKAFLTYEEWDYYGRCGKMVFMYPGMVPDMSELRQQPSGGRILFIVRPGELGLTDPIYRITNPTGKECLWLCQL
jgi:4-amino-4-deoxy-L-arabinose transferase-like glycosyltransferase